jgi:Glycosyl transferase family 2
MNLIGLMPVRNEAWCLGFTLRVALKWCDKVVVLLHNCTDASEAIASRIADEYPGSRVILYSVASAEWNEMQDRQVMLTMARAAKATHIAMVDADEFLTANLLPKIRNLIQGAPANFMLDLPLYNLRQQPDTWKAYHTNGVWGNRWVATAFEDRPNLGWGGDTFHHREPFGADWRGRRVRLASHSQGGTLHLWGASERRLCAKHALYRIAERLRWPDKPASIIEYVYDPATNRNSVLAQRMNAAGAWSFEAVKPEWLAGYEDILRYLDVDAEPWQIAEVKRLVLEHGREKFHGLDLLGVPEW